MPSAGCRNGSVGGLCIGCTATLGISTVTSSTVPYLHTDILFTFR